MLSAVVGCAPRGGHGQAGKEKGMLHRIFNLPNICGTAAFLLIFIFGPAAVEQIPAAAVLMEGLGALCAWIAIKEGGDI